MGSGPTKRTTVTSNPPRPTRTVPDSPVSKPSEDHEPPVVDDGRTTTHGPRVTVGLTSGYRSRYESGPRVDGRTDTFVTNVGGPDTTLTLDGPVTTTDRRTLVEVLLVPSGGPNRSIALRGPP